MINDKEKNSIDPCPNDMSEYKTVDTMIDRESPAEEAHPELETAVTVSGNEPGGTEPSGKKPPEPADGQILAAGEKIGKYVIEKRLGKGGMGEVYLATHETLGIQRAIKVLPREIAEKNSQFLARFLREAKTACEIRHSNVVNVMDVESDEARRLSYIVMEYVDGGDVRGLLKASGRLTIDQAVVVVEAVASALAAAAEFGIVHRDIKPDNIMLTRRGDVKLADLGIAKSAEEDVNLTKTNVMMGTPAYLSPEQARDAKHVDIRADIYSLGATFFEMLTGRIPYQGSSTYDILSKLFSDPVPNPCDFNAEVPPEIGKIVVRMLAKEPEKRYQSAEELLEVLVNCRAQRRTAVESQKLIREAIATAFGAEAVSFTTVSGRRKRKYLPLKIAAAVFMLVALIGGLYLVFSGDAKSPPLPPTPGKPVPEVPAAKYRMSFKISPAGASVTVKNRAGREIPFTARSGAVFSYELPAGFYFYSASMNGYHPVDSTVEVSGDAEMKEIVLRPTVFTVQSIPKARIELSRDGRAVAEGIADDNGLFTMRGIPEGRYPLSASLEGYVSRREEIEVAGAADTKLHFSLAPEMREVEFSAVPGTAMKLYRDGKETASFLLKERMNRLKLPFGEYRAELALKGHTPGTVNFNVPGNPVNDVRLTKNSFDVRLNVQPPKVRAELIREDGGAQPVTAYVSGSHVFSGLSPGNYILALACDGYENYREILTVADDEIRNIAMKKLPVADTGSGGIIVSGIKSNSPELEKFIAENGAEMKVREKDSEWRIVKFPYTVTDLPSGEYTLIFRVGAKKIRGQASDPIRVEQGKFTEYTMTMVTF